jgi:hypothetical protein
MYGFDRNKEQLFAREHKQRYLSTYEYSCSFVILEDKTGSIWYYTPDEIVKVVRRKKYFRVYDPDPFEQNNINCVAGYYNTLWLGSLNGIYTLELDDGIFRLHYGVPVDIGPSRYSAQRIIIDSRNHPWFGCIRRECSKSIIQKLVNL